MIRIFSSLLFILFVCANSQAQEVHFESTNPELQDGFSWAKQQAMKYVHPTGDPVGGWYEAALPGRDAFCMRDVSHQITGANILGLEAINRNMLDAFATSISVSRDWCGYWEIDKFNRPAPVDYRNDEDFWYNLPANFDVLDACYRHYLWTGDRSMITSDTFSEFYQRSTTSYVLQWDNDGDGIMSGPSSKEFPYRGIGSYNEADEGTTGNDLLAAQSRGFRSYAEILRLKERTDEAQFYTRKSELVLQSLNEKWWNPEGYYWQFLTSSGKWLRNDPMQLFLLRWDCVPLPRARKIIKSLGEQAGDMNVEMLSYLPLEAFRYGDAATGRSLLKKLTSPELKRREYPEVSFAALEAYVVGLMGFRPDATRSQITTLSHLAVDDQATLRQLPVFGGTVDLAHNGMHSSWLTNHTSREITWQVIFYSQTGHIQLDGRRTRTRSSIDLNGQPVRVATVVVAPGQTILAEIR